MTRSVPSEHLLLRIIACCLLLFCTSCGDKPKPPAPVPPKPKPVPEPPATKLEKPATVDFRFLVDRKKHPELIDPALASLRESGPLKVVEPQGMAGVSLRWFPIYDITLFAYSEASLRIAERDAGSFLAENLSAVAADYGGELYVLTWNTPDKSLRAEEGNWAVIEAFVFGRHDPKTNPPPDSLVYTLDARGGWRMRQLTSSNMNEWMTLVIDNRLLLATRITRALDASGVLSGGYINFNDEQLVWLRRKLLNLPENEPEKPPVKTAPKNGPAEPTPVAPDAPTKPKDAKAS